MKFRAVLAKAAAIVCLGSAVLPAASFACDTWVALPDATKAGFTILAKNSDRPLFDCQPLVFQPRMKWPKGASIDLGRVTIPQVAETYATLGSSPYWCWGYEEGMNEFGVAIGNEGVFTKALAENVAALKAGRMPGYGPTGMDILRLGLERGKTAKEALKVMTGLVEKHGQFGSGLPATPDTVGSYDNSFLIADPKEAWVLETAGNHWAARRFTKGTTSISNGLSMGAAWDLLSRDMMKHAVDRGWWDAAAKEPFDFTAAYSDDSPGGARRMQSAQTRAACSARLLAEREEQVDAFWMMRIARDRSSSPSIDLDQTASSCVAVLPKGKHNIPVFWWCPSVPSASCYVPFFVHGSAIPASVAKAGTFGKRIAAPDRATQDQFSPDSYWWLFRDLSALVGADRDARAALVRGEFDKLEGEFEAGLTEVTGKAASLRSSGKHAEAAAVLDAYTARCVEKAEAKVEELRAQFASPSGRTGEDFEQYTGIYTANFGNFKYSEFKVLVQNGRLAVDIPGQMVVEMNEPDPEGRRTLQLAPHVAFSFDLSADGRVGAMLLHQATSMPRKSGGALESGDIPEAYKPYIGTYQPPMSPVEITALVKEGALTLNIPNQGVVKLHAPDDKGRWRFADSPTTAVSFESGADGAVTAMKLHQTFRLPRGKSAAAAVDRAISESGIEAGLAKYRELKAETTGEHYFSEGDFNRLGYTLLQGGKVAEAVEIFKLNVEAHPDSWNAYDSLAEAYLTQGLKELAARNYRKSIELNPENRGGIEALKKLQEGE